MNKTRLRVGDFFTLADINNGKIYYTHTSNLTDTTDTDSFEFILFDIEGDITRARYSSCFLTEYNITVPENGIYTYEITINGASRPTAVINVLNAETNSSIQITPLIISSSSDGFNADDIIISASKPTSGAFIVNGVESDVFTQQEINKGNVYFKTYSEPKSEQITLSIVNGKSKSITETLQVNVETKFEFTGDNVIYQQILADVYLNITTNRPNVIFVLKNGITKTPIGVVYKVDDDLIPFTEYNEVGTTNTAVGEGVNKLPQYRNYKNITYWDGGLSYGVSLNSRGELLSNTHIPEIDLGSDQWVLPVTPREYPFVVEAIDTVTGKSIEREYKIITTYTGFGPNGESTTVI
ncbi:hypothetical protein FDI40_gp021 [Agrobacterium phage Atu_ph07]|uniref:Uncharacterized protein n=1 Tax=Agrobacterium phage Atu_ph07 TaxID=2024264 RepID=A0A2L0UZ75_9CAUD|nr:hypothetical protein FDI40_gp021 [Agrobacterium phage Atu_ph07]AUZ94833.1 hypothetical protein [Agrobacterium phage Atu_ph07]